MANQIKIQTFQSLRKYFQTLGTLSPKSENRHPFNLRNTFVLFCYFQMFASVLAFTMFKATTVVEFGLNYYGYMTEVLCAFVILTQIYRMVDILELIGKCEQFMQKSKSTEFSFCVDFVCNGKYDIDLVLAREPCNDHVYQSEWKNWAMEQNNLLYFTGNIICWSCFTTIAHNLRQLFLLWFERRVLLFAISSDVSVPELTKSDEINRRYSFTQDCHLIGRHRWDLGLLWRVKRLPAILHFLVQLQLYAFWLDCAYSWLVLLKIWPMI